MFGRPARGKYGWAAWLLLVAVGGLGRAAAQEPAAAPAVEIVGLDGGVVSGRLLQVVPELKLATEDGELSRAWRDVLNVRPVAAEFPSTQAATSLPLRFNLADGSSFAGEITAGGKAELAVRLSGGQAGHLDPMSLRSIRSTTASDAAGQKLDEAIAEHEDSSAVDVVVVARRDKVAALRGRVGRIDQQGLDLEWNGRQVRLPWPHVVGVVFAEPAPRSASCIVRLRNGDALAGRIVGGLGRTVTLNSSIFDELVLAWADVERVDCRSARLVTLSELRPRGYEFEPLFDKQWDYGVDQTLTGGPIRLGGREFTSGVTMHSRARLTYALEGRFVQFAATVGIVDEMGSRGCVTLRVLGDGQVLWEASGVRGGQPPRDVSVPVAGVQELQLVVDYGADLDLSDHAAWGFARLIRAGGGD